MYGGKASRFEPDPQGPFGLSLVVLSVEGGCGGWSPWASGRRPPRPLRPPAEVGPRPERDDDVEGDEREDDHHLRLAQRVEIARVRIDEQLPEQERGDPEDERPGRTAPVGHRPPVHEGERDHVVEDTLQAHDEEDRQQRLAERQRPAVGARLHAAPAAQQRPPPPGGVSATGDRPGEPPRQPRDRPTDPPETFAQPREPAVDLLLVRLQRAVEDGRGGSEDEQQEEREQEVGAQDGDAQRGVLGVGRVEHEGGRTPALSGTTSTTRPSAAVSGRCRARRGGWGWGGRVGAGAWRGAARRGG